MEPSKAFKIAKAIASMMTPDELRELDKVLKDPTEQAFLVYHLQAEAASIKELERLHYEHLSG